MVLSTLIEAHESMRRLGPRFEPRATAGCMALRRPIMLIDPACSPPPTRRDYHHLAGTPSASFHALPPTACQSDRLRSRNLRFGSFNVPTQPTSEPESHQQGTMANRRFSCTTRPASVRVGRGLQAAHVQLSFLPDGCADPAGTRAGPGPLRAVRGSPGGALAGPDGSLRTL